MDWTKIELLDLQSLTLKQHNNLPAVGGIYFCIAQNQLLYIGQSKNLNQRWKNHHRYHELISKEDVNIHWIECDKKKERIEAERLLIKHHKPVLNFRRTRLKIGFSNRRKQHILLSGSVSPNMLFNEMLELYRISAKELSKIIYSTLSKAVIEEVKRCQK